MVEIGIELEEDEEEEEEGEEEIRDSSLEVDPHIEASKRYRQTENGKDAIKRVNNSPAAKEARARYAKTPAGVLAAARYRNSEKGKQWREDRKRKQARAALMSEREEQGLCGLCGEADHKADFHIEKI